MTRPVPPPLAADADRPMLDLSIASERRVQEKSPPPRVAGPQRRGSIFAIVIVLTGVVAGLGGMALALLLHFVQHLAYGYSVDAVMGPESFLEGVIAASPARRVAALTTCGVVAGFGWWAVRRFGRPLVSVKAAVSGDMPAKRMPPLATIAHVLLQIVTVGLGSPLGREVAPREFGALLATWLSSAAGLAPEETRIAIACGAGAGLAAVYNVPLGGAVFVLEVLLGAVTPRLAIAALAASVIGSTVAWIGLGDVSQYKVPDLEISPSLVAWSVVAGPIFGVAAYGFRTITKAAAAHHPDGWRRIPWCLAVFLALGLLATLFPQLPGNGKGPAQLEFDGDLGVKLAGCLLILKLLAVTAALRAGAAGGVLTPSLTIGALLANVLASAWSLVLPGTPTGAFAVVGAAAFLASSMNMPLTAIMLAMEFTRVGHDFLVPILIAVVGSIAALQLCARREARRSPSH
jgi:H+/Cl- antiporter ClcA